MVKRSQPFAGSLPREGSCEYATNASVENTRTHPHTSLRRPEFLVAAHPKSAVGTALVQTCGRPAPTTKDTLLPRANHFQSLVSHQAFHRTTRYR